MKLTEQSAIALAGAVKARQISASREFLKRISRGSTRSIRS